MLNEGIVGDVSAELWEGKRQARNDAAKLPHVPRERPKTSDTGAAAWPNTRPRSHRLHHLVSLLRILRHTRLVMIHRAPSLHFDRCRSVNLMQLRLQVPRSRFMTRSTTKVRYRRLGKPEPVCERYRRREEDTVYTTMCE